MKSIKWIRREHFQICSILLYNDKWPGSVVHAFLYFIMILKHLVKGN